MGRKVLVVFLFFSATVFSYARPLYSGLSAALPSSFELSKPAKVAPKKYKLLSPLNPGPGEEINKLQDSLQSLAYKVINEPEEAERYNASFKMVRTLVQALKLPGSYNFSFDSLKSVSIQNSPDQRFRIFTWHVMNQNGSYRFYGTIQMNNPEKLQLYPLIDYTTEIKAASDTTLNNEKWLGAQYYKIIPVTKDTPTPYYILLGWKGNTVKSTKKVIEVLYFKDNKANFGLPVFDGNKQWRNNKRIIFEYNRSTSMMLNYVAKDNTMVFDHLAAPDPEMEGNYAMYGPDLSYDGFKLQKGRWKFLNNIRLMNPESETDQLYIDPTKPSTEIINKMR